MPRVHRVIGVWLALTAALLFLGAAPLAAARPELRAAPLSRAFLRFQVEQQQLHALGLDRVPSLRPELAPQPLDISYLEGRHIASPAATYPSSYDLRALGRVSPVRAQEPYGTCWAFATMGALESAVRPGEQADYSENNLVMNSGFVDGDTDPYWRGGFYEWSAAYLLRWSGPVYEIQDPYGHPSPPGIAPVKHVQEVRFIPGGSSGSDTSNIKYALTTWGAVGTLMHMDASAFNASNTAYYYRGNEVGFHAVDIVGWDDDYPAAAFATPPPGNGAWIMRNSWGTGWAQNGYIWVSYYDRFCGTARVTNIVFDGVQPASNYSDIYSCDPLGLVRWVGLGDDTAWGANVFTARAAQSISAAGFYAAVPGTSYTVYAGDTLSALQARGSGSCSTPGFFTVALSPALAVSAGSQFVVAVRLTTPDDDSPLPVELVAPWYSNATAVPGQSYWSHDGSSWTDLTDWNSTANVCLKAYAAWSGPIPTPMPVPIPTPTPTPPPVLLDSHLSLRPTADTVQRRHTLVLACTLRPAASRRPITLERLVGGVWTVKQRGIAASADGKARFAVTFARSGVVLLRASVAANDTYGPATSGTARVRVP